MRFFLFFVISLAACSTPERPALDHRAAKARQNAVLANEGFMRCHRFLIDWLNQRDSTTGLIPRNLKDGKDIWNAKDAAADNYPFMVLTAALLDRPLFDGKMREMLETETRLTSRIGHLPDTYSFSKGGFVTSVANLPDIIFGSSEYIKDGLLPLTEWLGPSPWRDRMLLILDDIWENAFVETPYGKIPSTNTEVNGEMLQTLSRVYWMTGEEKYLDWAIRLGDFYLLGDHHPTNDFNELRLRDHGCEIVSGLSELYFTIGHARKDHWQSYRSPIQDMLKRILEVGVNEHGLMYDAVNPQTGEVTKPRIADNWGYNLNGFYTVALTDWLIGHSDKDRTGPILQVFHNLGHYKNFDWENGSQDGYADAIEGGLNLYNRIRDSTVRDWLDSEIKVMWSMQDSSHRKDTEQWRNSGIIEGWHGDGNFARTTLMYCLWKTQGTYMRPWRKDLLWGATREGDTLNIVIESQEAWTGKLYFDQPRHKTFLNLPADYPRINQFPEWFVADLKQSYRLQSIDGKIDHQYTGLELIDGVPLELAAGQMSQLLLSKANL